MNQKLASESRQRKEKVSWEMQAVSFLLIDSESDIQKNIQNISLVFSFTFSFASVCMLRSRSHFGEVV